MLLIQAATRAGHYSAPLYSSLLCPVLAADGTVDILNLPAERPDIVISRTGSASPRSSLLVLQQFIDMGVYVPNPPDALAAAHHKFGSMQRLRANGVPVPPSVMLFGRETLKSAVEVIPGPPWILKMQRGTKGIGVMLVESESSLRSVVDCLLPFGQPLILQRYVGTGADLRVLVVNGKAIAAMARQADPDEFRANIHRGGRATAVPLDPELTDIAERAAEALGLIIAGVDVLDGDGKRYVCEVNSAPGLTGLQSVSDADLASAVISGVVEAFHRRGPLDGTEDLVDLS